MNKKKVILLLVVIGVIIVFGFVLLYIKVQNSYRDVVTLPEDNYICKGFELEIDQISETEIIVTRGTKGRTFEETSVVILSNGERLDEELYTVGDSSLGEPRGTATINFDEVQTGNTIQVSISVGEIACPLSNIIEM